MWKDFFYFNKGEKRAIICLTILILSAQAALWTTDYWIPLLPEKLTNMLADKKTLETFQDSLIGKGSDRFNYKKGNINKGVAYSKTISGKLIPFNPNIADSVLFVSLGLKPYVARNILKYRKKGGVFRKTEDFARIYGIEPALFERIKPFIRLQDQRSDFPQKEQSLVSTGNVSEISRQNNVTSAVQATSSVSKPAELNRMEINRMDTTTLQQLKGIGSVTADRITRYRNRLGGFYSMHQLEEIKGLYPETLTRLQAMLKMDTTQITKLNANKVSLEKLKAHPYISFYQAKVIVELRKARSGIKNIRELADFKEFTAADIERLKWYLAF
ncbi:MAG TPA: helix-hairpin-helix domain-containing protein [Paludibacter sp.]